MVSGRVVSSKVEATTHHSRTKAYFRMGADKIMNLLCPNCQKMITVPDQNAGQMMKCPLCAGTFTAPSFPASMASSPSGSPPLGSSMNPGNPGSNPGEGDI